MLGTMSTVITKHTPTIYLINQQTHVVALSMEDAITTYRGTCNVPLKTVTALFEATVSPTVMEHQDPEEDARKRMHARAQAQSTPPTEGDASRQASAYAAVHSGAYEEYLQGHHLVQGEPRVNPQTGAIEYVPWHRAETWQGEPRVNQQTGAIEYYHRGFGEVRIGTLGAVAYTDGIAPSRDLRGILISDAQSDQRYEDAVAFGDRVHEAEGFNKHIKASANTDESRCTVASQETEGEFYCSRANDHYGPCAAVPRKP